MHRTYRSAGAVVVSSDPANPLTLLLEQTRANGERQTVAPKGTINAGESPLAAAREETGIAQLLDADLARPVTSLHETDPPWARQCEADGLGLSYGVVRLVRVPPRWSTIGARLCRRVTDTLAELVIAVEHVGSTAVPGMAAKPILDLAAAVAPGVDASTIRSRLQQAGWIYRGDGGTNGGLLFVLNGRPNHRVAHLHIVEHGDQQWRRYLALRDLLRRDPEARARYEAAKRTLAGRFADDRRAYTSGKTEIILQLLDLGPSDQHRP